MGLLTATSSLATCGTATCGNQGCFDIYQPSGDHHHIITSSSASSLNITYGQGDTLGGSHPNSPWTCTCTAASCPRLVGSFTCNADFYGSTSLNIGLSNGAYTFEPANGMALDVRTCELFPDKSSLQGALAEWTSNATSARMKYGSISAWEVGAVTDMSSLIYNKASFDEDIDAWDVSKVTSMYRTFMYASTFNHPLGSWQVGQVTDFKHMFYFAFAINQDISGWNVSQANTMGAMFANAHAFDKCNTMALDTSACPNVAVHDSFEAQNPSKWAYTYKRRP